MDYKLAKGEFVLLEFETWDFESLEDDEGILNLYDCILKAPIGEFKVGDLILIIRIGLYTGGTLQVLDEEGIILSEYDYSLILYDVDGGKIITNEPLIETVPI